MNKTIVLPILLFGLYSPPAEAQQCREIKSPASPITDRRGWTNWGWTLRVAGKECVGLYHYQNPAQPSEKGTRTVRYSTVTDHDGGKLCSDGQWYNLGGPNAGQPGGSLPGPYLLKGGKMYRC